MTEKPKSDEGVPVEIKEETKVASEEPTKVVTEVHHEARGQHTKIEGGSKKAFTTKVFRRKSG